MLLNFISGFTHLKCNFAQLWGRFNLRLNQYLLMQPGVCVDHSCYVVHPQIDLETVKDMYLEKYDVTLKDALDSECGGDFKRLLIEILH